MATKRKHCTIEKSAASAKSKLPCAPNLSPYSVEVTKMTWQEELGTISERDNYMLNNAIFTDCIFIIGETGYGEKPKEIKCHRLHLAKSSPVFATMLYGELWKHEVINIPDVNLQAFNMMLKYIYSGSIDLSDYSYELTCGFLYVAKKYMLPKPLQAYIRGYLWHHIYPDNVWSAIMFAQANDEPELEKTAWQVVEDNTYAVLQLENFKDIPMSMLQSLVERENLTCTEFELFDDCMRWAMAEAERQNLDTEPENLREILSPIISHIRFLAMTGKDFARSVRQSNVLTDNEVLPISLNLNYKNSEILPDTICRLYTKRTIPIHETFHVLGYLENKHIGFTNSNFVKGYIFPFDEEESVIGIEVPAQIKPVNTDRNTYDEKLTVFVHDENSKIVLRETFQGNIHYGTVIQIPFNNPITKKNDNDDNNYKYFAIAVLFHKSGTYPARRKNYFHKNIRSEHFGPHFETRKFYGYNFKYIHNVVYTETV